MFTLNHHQSGEDKKPKMFIHYSHTKHFRFLERQWNNNINHVDWRLTPSQSRYTV
jgi:hypothetical protein